MDANRKKELRAEYKDRRADAGVVSIRCIETSEIYFAAATDIPATFNKMEFQLSSGLCPNKQLQEQWDRFGEGAFEFSIVQRLEDIDSDEDIAEELETLLDLCLTEKLEAKRWKAGHAIHSR